MILYYVHDPMCSWCWGLKPVLEQLQNNLPTELEMKFLLGGLAPDTNSPMPENMQSQIRSTWQRIQETIPGTQFNYDFWEKCTPKRSTYLSCRAVLSAGKQQKNKSFEMLTAIQKAYYLHALNPSDISTLRDLANNIGLNIETFNDDIESEEINKLLSAEISMTRGLGVDSFPSLVLNKNGANYPIALDYNHSDIILDHIKSFI
jgi:putative protein-disulfide isomerase